MFVANDDDSIRVFDITNAAAPIHIYTALFQGVGAIGTNIALTCEENQSRFTLRRYDIRRPDSISLISIENEPMGPGSYRAEQLNGDTITLIWMSVMNHIDFFFNYYSADNPPVPIAYMRELDAIYRPGIGSFTLTMPISGGGSSKIYSIDEMACRGLAFPRWSEAPFSCRASNNLFVMS